MPIVYALKYEIKLPAGCHILTDKVCMWVEINYSHYIWFRYIFVAECPCQSFTLNDNSAFQILE